MQDETIQTSSIQDLFTAHPCHITFRISKEDYEVFSDYHKLWYAPIHIECESDLCKGERFFNSLDASTYVKHNKLWQFTTITYQCKNCNYSKKTFAIAAFVHDNILYSYKFGESPAKSPKTPSRLISLLGPGRDNYLRGRRCEIEEFGIGAFAYYRRVLEDQTDRLLDQSLKVCRQLGASKDIQDQLLQAQKDRSYTRKLELAGDSIPDSLKIKGHSPFKLLHGFLSEGLHKEDDKVCLEAAKDIRLVLSELATRMDAALRENTELNQAISRLMKPVNREEGN